MNPEVSQKKELNYRTRISFALSTVLLLLSLEYHPHHVDNISLTSKIIARDDQTIIEVEDYRGSASAILAKKGDLNLLNVHLAQSEGGMLNAEFSGPLPADGETTVYELDDTHYIWFIEKDISDKRTSGRLVLRNENGNLYGEVFDTGGTPMTFVLRI